MTVRRLNYTGRKRVLREHAAITIRSRGGLPWFDAALDLGSYDLPAGARVFVEASRQAAWQRFDFGTVGDIRPAGNRSLEAFGSGVGVRFRLRVVPRATGGTPTAVLAQADGIQGRSESPDEGATESLLHVDYDDFSDRPWKLDEEEPLLLVSRDLVPDKGAFVQSREFATMVLPEVLRQILQSITQDGSWPEFPEDHPKSPWVTFVTDVLDVALPEDADGKEDWIDKAVTAWCETQRIAAAFREWHRDE